MTKEDNISDYHFYSNVNKCNRRQCGLWKIRNNTVNNMLPITCTLPPKSLNHSCLDEDLIDN